MKHIPLIFIFFICCCQSVAKPTPAAENEVPNNPGRETVSTKTEDELIFDGEQKRIDPGNTKPEELLAFANTLVGTPYLYASIDPAQGFDCSGFITYVFNHFNVAVPRSSVDFTDIEPEVPLAEAKPGDLVLFTGTDSTIRVVGHMGIVTENDPTKGISWIHSSSGKANGVTITAMNHYYMGRFVKVIRVFNP